MIEKAKNKRKSNQPNFIQPILQAAPYSVNLEYRVQGIDTNPNIHDVEAEMVYVVDGAGVLTIGGKLKDERRTNDKNRTGSKLEGGTPRRIAKGDYVMIPENTAHSFTQVEGRLVIMSVHLPRNGAANYPAAWEPRFGLLGYARVFRQTRIPGARKQAGC